MAKLLSISGPSPAEHGRISIFNKSTIAFAPANEVPSEIDAIANLPAPHLINKSPELDFTRRRSMHGSADISRPKPSTATGKVPLPRPYKRQWVEIERRRGKRDFIYGRDVDYEFSERDSKVKTSCCGCLVFHVIELLDLVVNKQSFLDNVPVSFYCLLSIGATKRCTKIVHATQSRQVRIDAHVHLSIEVSEWREAPSNRLRLELWSFQDPEAHFIVGTMETHIYSIIRVQHKIDTVHLWSDGIRVGKLAYEVAFSYGAYGYGHSNQLKNFSQPIMETISHSIFPRIKLDSEADIADRAFKARKPEKLKLFTYHSLILEVDEKNPNIPAFFGRTRETNFSRRAAMMDLEPKPIVVQQVEFEQGFPVHCKIHMNIWQKIMQSDFNDMFGEYVCIGHKRERLEYLTNLVQGRMRDKFEEETGPIFNYLTSKQVETIHRSNNPPGTLVYPKKIPCPYSEPYTLASEDEKFQSEFPPVRRSPGFLSTLFGFEKKEENTLNDMDYPLYKEAKLPQSNSASKNFNLWIRNWLQTASLRVTAAFVKLYSFVFPELREEPDIPEISVTVATPEGSTTNIYSYFTRDLGGVGNLQTTKVDKLVKQTTTMIDNTRKSKGSGKKGEDESDTNEDSEDDNDEDEDSNIKIDFQESENSIPPNMPLKKLS
ncbi:hypothetical protein Ocin01_06583 [Orchesella cincta]|uniref:Cation channel sperm-associated targeting subunit tau C2 domain-containing protein n=1 Tax=Orchesella cincta TaxID=48709 RepID=A0A1D2N4F7_ORCCI|nr:hypothetical protein Ocin01_06583 [Orchesella cincta]